MIKFRTLPTNPSVVTKPANVQTRAFGALSGGWLATNGIKAFQNLNLIGFQSQNHAPFALSVLCFFVSDSQIAVEQANFREPLAKLFRGLNVGLRYITFFIDLANVEIESLTALHKPNCTFHLEAPYCAAQNVL